MSEGAAKRLSALRVRRLLRLELDGLATIDAPHVGTLEGDDLIRVWIDVPIERRAVVEVRRVDGKFARRALAIGGFPSDVAAEVVTLAAAEMVRVQARTSSTPAPAPQPREPAPARTYEGFAASGAAAVLLLPSNDPLLYVGPELALELRHGMFAHRLYGAWQIGAGGHAARWLEIGAGIDFRWPFADSWRMHLGVKGGFVELSLPEAIRVDGEADDHAWTVRVAGAIGIEAELTPGAWLGLAVEPGAAIRPVDVVDASGQSELGGFALGMSLALTASPFETEPQDE